MARVAAALTLLAAATLVACSSGPGTADEPRRATPSATDAEATAAPRRDAVRRRLRRLERAFDGRIGAVAVDAGSGRTIAHRAGERFPLASTFKAFAAAAILRKARRSDPGLLDRVIHYTRDDLNDCGPRECFAPVTEKHLDSGMTVAQLCRAAITHSDNAAANLLLEEIGGPAQMTRFFRSLGDRDSRLDRWEIDLSLWRPGERRDTTTPAAIAADLRKLALGRALHPRDRARFNGWLRANTTGGRRIRAGLPKSWTIGDKTGTGFLHGAANDIAVAQPPRGAPIVIAIYTSRRAAEAATDEATIARTATILARGLNRLR